MKKHILSHPAMNVTGISLFSAFYAAVFFVTASSQAFSEQLQAAATGVPAAPFWRAWNQFLAAGSQVWIAWLMLAATGLVLLILFRRRHPYDEYHTAILLNCLAVATVLTLLAIALFFLLILCDPTWFVAKFMLFAAIHWVTVVLADLIYLLICKPR